MHRNGSDWRAPGIRGFNHVIMTLFRWGWGKVVIIDTSKITEQYTTIGLFGQEEAVALASSPMQNHTRVAVPKWRISFKDRILGKNGWGGGEGTPVGSWILLSNDSNPPHSTAPGISPYASLAQLPRPIHDK